MKKNSKVCNLSLGDLCVVAFDVSCNIVPTTLLARNMLNECFDDFC